MQIFRAVVLCLMPYEATSELDKLEAEFLDHQLMDKNEIPGNVWDSAVTVVDGAQKYYRMDKIWNFMSSMVNPDGIHRFHWLVNVAKLVLILPHSNVSEERVFGMVTKNKTIF